MPTFQDIVDEYKKKFDHLMPLVGIISRMRNIIKSNVESYEDVAAFNVIEIDLYCLAEHLKFPFVNLEEIAKYFDLSTDEFIVLIKKICNESYGIFKKYFPERINTIREGLNYLEEVIEIDELRSEYYAEMSYNK